MAEEQPSTFHYNGKDAWEVYGVGENDHRDCVTNITFDPSITIIGTYAFAYCTNITTVDIPETITTIQHGAFRECSNLRFVNIPDTVTIIEKQVFVGCPKLLRNPEILQRINDIFIQQHYHVTRNVLTLEQGPGPNYEFQGKTQKGWGPHMGGLTMEQMEHLWNHPCIHDRATMRDIVELVIKPITKQCGIGYALLINQDEPLQARVMVSVRNAHHLQSILFSSILVGHSLTLSSVLFYFASIACMGRVL